MHKNEAKINIDIVKDLVYLQFPKWKKEPIKEVTHSGTDNIVYKLGKDRCIRFPRTKQGEYQIKEEQKWLPKLRPELPLNTPRLIDIGKPDNNYPYVWSIYDWIEGAEAYDNKPIDLNDTAKLLANFINSLHKISAKFAPQARRGLPLISQNDDVQQAILDLKSLYDPKAIASLWKNCLQAPEWHKPGVWLHGDLLPSNLIVKEGKLHGIIDFGLFGKGDPACDLIPAWCLFDAASRETFKDHLNIDENTWTRGRGWALSIALIIIPYYTQTNPKLVSIAKNMIDQILEEWDRSKT
tara:strand:- start:13881 stop:14768 length:888 start_codon:yes stop_codon:yes gene_type:complete